ncbi:DUF6913 domain-containing protein [Ichthyenterobacterium magnum]|uniref:Uncharacterized protein n=1 Tax=Ichthyenterobacterium magnum TaxID=1230530 RepID=A0A420DLC2_9FLAO|nr:hypothetical protein [Ichthyenterobacterium magnum]RKE95076.1 hypothetical protein BXY80_1259 [Ichthyenterobacterium magnum]
MIFKAFKEKSNQKYINKLLNARRVAVSNTKIDSVGVILHLSEFSDFEAFRAYFKSLNIQHAKLKIIAFVEDSKDANLLWDTYFNPKDFGWKGKVNNIDLQTFIDTKFDALISYYKDDVLELNLITALSKANFKVGLTTKDDRLYDLMIDVSPKNFKLFKTELTKYLTVLNKI